MKAPLYKGKSWFGALSEVQETPLDMYPRIHQALGPIVRVKLIPGMEMISVASPEAMEHILRKNQSNYPKLWDQASAFIPERFEATQVAERPKYTSIPFGLGKRQCIGMNMANVEGPLILALLAQRFQPALAEPNQEVLMDATFALRPKDSLPMTIVAT